MKTTNRIALVLIGFAVLGFAAATASADPLPGQILKFQQKPMDGVMINGTQYWGHDEESTARGYTGGYSYEGNFMADDFSDTVRQDVVHVKWWGSYQYDGVLPSMYRARKFLIGFEHDIPADPSNPDSYSMPDPYNSDNVYQIVTKVGVYPMPAGTFTEKVISGGGLPLQEALFEYNAELACPFPQQPDTVYWLKIVALYDQTVQQYPWGWHNRDYTVQDPYASPVVNPGEYVQEKIPDPNGTVPTPIWHHQDDAVTGYAQIRVGSTGLPCDVQVEQWEMSPTNYLDYVDGPGPFEMGTEYFRGIGAFSKDLAFELYAIPEPSTIVLLGLGIVCLLAVRRR